MRHSFDIIDLYNSLSKKFPWVFPIIYFAFITLLIYGLKISPILFNDDWCHLRNIQSPGFSMLHERRPFHSILPWLMIKIFPVYKSITPNYYLQVFILYLTALTVFFLVKRLLRNKSWIAFLVALLFLTYPNDYTRLYITTSGIRLSLLLLFLGFLLFIDVFSKDAQTNLLFIVPLNIASFLMYEGQLGLAVVWPLVVIILFPEKISKKKIISLLGYYSSIGIFVVWRLFIQPLYYADNKLAYLDTIKLNEIASKYLDGIRVLFAGFSFPYDISGWITTKNIILVTIIFFLILLAIIITNYLIGQEELEKDRKTSLTSSMKVLLAGFILWGAGYFPIVLNYPPNIYGHLSRVNIFSTLGATLMILSILYLCFLGFRIGQTSSAKFSSWVALSLVFFGAIVQIQVQEAYNESWESSKEFYSILFDTIPDIKKDTHVVLILRGYQNEEGLFRPLFSSSWESWCIFNTLYKKEGLRVSYRYTERTTPNFPSENSLTSILETNTITKIDNLSKLIVLEYDNATKILDISRDIDPIVSDAHFGSYLPEERILPLQGTVPARKLVE